MMHHGGHHCYAGVDVDVDVDEVVVEERSGAEFEDAGVS